MLDWESAHLNCLRVLPLGKTLHSILCHIRCGARSAIHACQADADITSVVAPAGVTLESFEGSQKLSSFFELLSTAKDRQGKEYVNTIEGKQVSCCPHC